MVSIKSVIVGVFLGFLFSFLAKRNDITNLYFVDSKNKIDTLFHNDTTFTVFNFNSEFTKISLEYFPSKWIKKSKLKGESVEIHNLIFHKNGKLGYLKIDYRDTLKDNQYLYETQRLSLDSTGVLESFNLCKDFKRGWYYPK